jgi:hypothetical protein
VLDPDLEVQANIFSDTELPSRSEMGSGLVLLAKSLTALTTQEQSFEIEPATTSVAFHGHHRRTLLLLIQELLVESQVFGATLTRTFYTNMA